MCGFLQRSEEDGWRKSIDLKERERARAFSPWAQKRAYGRIKGSISSALPAAGESAGHCYVSLSLPIDHPFKAACSLHCSQDIHQAPLKKSSQKGERQPERKDTQIPLLLPSIYRPTLSPRRPVFSHPSEQTQARALLLPIPN
jgi:hypothetical protein